MHPQPTENASFFFKDYSLEYGKAAISGVGAALSAKGSKFDRTKVPGGLYQEIVVHIIRGRLRFIVIFCAS